MRMIERIVIEMSTGILRPCVFVIILPLFLKLLLHGGNAAAFK